VAELSFLFTLSGEKKDRIRVTVQKEKGEIIKFVVQYEALIQGKWHPVVRYDTSHGFAHKDLIHPDGTEEKQPLHFQSFNAALTFAIQDIKISWGWYRTAYKKEFGDEKRNSH
jgi:hypothetical protein